MGWDLAPKEFAQYWSRLDRIHVALWNWGNAAPARLILIDDENRLCRRNTGDCPYWAMASRRGMRLFQDSQPGRRRQLKFDGLEMAASL
ncbi:hypothetical protein [Allomesorhizobium alhagi]|jgi:hypothetical protein|uniref:Uncharacterized protein n=1 Tax=Mesorhizobium alhagi CCNWXJ12-2 TaxID=1107882 RepID=H0HU44_9HYPH|nr:hypothetical protein [Mesorhizobium alhagi]EHK55680.1 hypothetical protein MAXJ12_18428 [Mesorhizobium alhagi CCNWXJ12-2]